MLSKAEQIRRIRAVLDPREIHALSRSYCDGLRQEAIAQVLGCSQQTVSRLLSSAEDKLARAGLRLPQPEEVERGTMCRLVGEAAG